MHVLTQDTDPTGDFSLPFLCRYTFRQFAEHYLDQILVLVGKKQHPSFAFQDKPYVYIHFRC